MSSSKKELVSVRIPKELNTRFAKHVASMGISKTAFILNLINKELRQNPIDSYSLDLNNTKSNNAIR